MCCEVLKSFALRLKLSVKTIPTITLEKSVFYTNIIYKRKKEREMHISKFPHARIVRKQVTGLAVVGEQSKQKKRQKNKIGSLFHGR